MFRRFADSDARSGFTLIEMILVMAVLVALAAVSFRSLGNFGDSQRMYRVADDLRGMLTGLRVRAMDEGKTYQWAFKPDSGDYLVRTAQADAGSVETREPIAGPLRSDGPDLVGPHLLEEELRFLPLNEPPTDSRIVGSDLTAAGWSVANFEPDGTCSDFSVGIVDRDGYAVIAHVAGRSGRVTIEGPIETGLGGQSFPQANRGR